MTASAIDRRDHAEPSRVEQVVADGTTTRLLCPAPAELDAIIRRIPEGRVLTRGELGAALARNHKADRASADAVTAALQIVAEAAEEDRRASARVAPYWRVVEDDGALVPTFPGGLAAQARALDVEGVTVLRLGAVPKVTVVTHFAWTPPPLGKRPKPVVPGRRRR
ncbi:MAG: MGMT family protein [Kofleriaceae bacterium]